MAYPTSRSMNEELSEGATDGKYKKVVQNRGGTVEAHTYDSRDCLDDAWYGIHEKSDKMRPDGKAVSTPNFVSTPEVDQTKD